MPKYEITCMVVEVDDEGNIIDDESQADFSFEVETDNPQKLVTDAVFATGQASDLCT